MLFLKYLPEIAAVLIFMLMATQLPSVGPFLILIEIALVGALFVFRTTTFLESALRWWPVLLAPIMAMVSGLWSEAPMISLRYGAQFLFTAFAGVLLARLLTPKRFVCALLVALFIFLIACIVSGRGGPSAEGWVLVGLTGSKNQIGYAAQVLLMAAVAVLMMRQVAPLLRWIALLSVPLAAYLLVGSNSATAIVIAGAGSIALIGLVVAHRFPPSGRLAAIVTAALVTAPLTALSPEIVRGVNYVVFDTMDKSPTLTGRTTLWARADDLIQRRPLFGYGYQSIWLGESTDTIALQRISGDRDGRAFHFHDQFRQIAVDTGWIGLAPFIALLIAAGFAGLRRFLLNPSVATSFFFVTFLMVVGKSFFDVILGPFSVHSLLFFSTVVYMFWRPEQAAAPAPALTRQRMRRAPA